MTIWVSYYDITEIGCSTVAPVTEQLYAALSSLMQRIYSISTGRMTTVLYVVKGMHNKLTHITRERV